MPKDATPDPLEKPTHLTATVDGLNIRATPSLSGTSIGSLNTGDVVERIDTSGDRYWHKIRFKAMTGWTSRKYLQPVVAGVPASDFPWFGIAYSEIGVREISGSGDNPRIVQYHRSTSLDAPSASQDETHWCSSFVNWCVERAGHAGTDSAWARSWLSWGKSTTSPVKGCIVVFERGASSGHVAFFVSKTSSQIKVLGGNQSDAVNISNYPASRLLGYRVPR